MAQQEIPTVDTVTRNLQSDHGRYESRRQCGLLSWFSVGNSGMHVSCRLHTFGILYNEVIFTTVLTQVSLLQSKLLHRIHRTLRLTCCRHIVCLHHHATCPTHSPFNYPNTYIGCDAWMRSAFVCRFACNCCCVCLVGITALGHTKTTPKRVARHKPLAEKKIHYTTYER